MFLAGSTQEPEEQYRDRHLPPTRGRSIRGCGWSSSRGIPNASTPSPNCSMHRDLRWQRRSELNSKPPAEPGADAARDCGRILLVDTVGELGAWWGTAPIAFVGGSFGSRGGQNMIEPAAYGAAVSFGPNTWNFRDIVAALLAADAAVVVRDRAELEAFVRRALEEPDWAAELGDRAQEFVQSNWARLPDGAACRIAVADRGRSSGGTSRGVVLGTAYSVRSTSVFGTVSFPRFITGPPPPV